MFRTFTAPMRFLFCVTFLMSTLFGGFVLPTEAVAPDKDEQLLINQPVPTEKEHVQPTKRVVDSHKKFSMSQADIELLARLVYAEGHGESLEGQIAIAAVVLNRIEDSHFPNNLRGVIFQPNAFSCIQDGKLPSRVDDTARQAVLEAIAGKDPSHGSFYFFNPDTATSSWIWSRSQAVVMGNHIFAK